MCKRMRQDLVGQVGNWRMFVAGFTRLPDDLECGTLGPLFGGRGGRGVFIVGDAIARGGQRRVRWAQPVKGSRQLGVVRKTGTTASVVWTRSSTVAMLAVAGS